MALPKVGVEAVVDNANGYLKSIKSIVDANDSATDSVKDTAKSFDVLNDSTDYARSVQKRYTEVLKDARSALDDTGKSTNFFKEGIAAAAVAVNASIAIFQAVASVIGFVGNIIGDVVRRVIDLGKHIFDTGVNFSKIMANIQAVTKMTGEETRNLSNDIIQLGMDSVAGPTAVADAYYDIASGVQSAGSQMTILELAIATAEAGQANLKDTTQGLITVFNAYDYGLAEITVASDVLTRTTDLGTRSMQEYVTAISSIAGQAAATGVKFEELGAAMSFITTKGLTAGQAATALQGIMTQLSRNTPGVTKALRAMGQESIEASIKNNGLAGTLGLLTEGAKKTGQNLQQLVGRVEAMKAVTHLGTDEFKAYFKTFMEGLDEATSKSREIQRLDVSAQLQLVAARFEGIGLSISQAVLPAFAKFLKFVNDAFAKLDWKKISAGLDKVGEALGKTVGNLVTKLGAMLEDVDWDKVAADVERVFTQISEFISNIDWDQVGALIGSVITSVQTFFTDAGSTIGNVTGVVGEGISQIQLLIHGLFTLADGFGQIISAGIENGRALVEGAIQHVKDGVNGIWMSLFGPEGAISTAVNETWPKVVEFLETARSNVETGVQAISDGVTAIWEALFGANGRVSTAVTEALDNARMAIDTAKTNIETAVNDVIAPIRSAWDGFWSGLGGKVTEAWEAVKNAVNSAVSGVRKAFEAVAGAIMAALAPALAAISTIAGGLSLLGGGGGGGGGPPGGAKGGTLQEGINIVGEQGAEAVVKHGNRAVVVSHQASRRLLAEAGTMGLPGAGATALSTALGMLRTMATPAMGYARPAAMPIPVGGGSTSNSSTVYNRNIDTININGVKGGESAVQRFARLQARRRT